MTNNKEPSDNQLEDFQKTVKVNSRFDLPIMNNPISCNNELDAYYILHNLTNFNWIV